MGKFVGAIITLALASVGYALGGPIGAIIGAAIGTVIVSEFLTPKAPRPQAAASQIKTPTPLRMYGYGRRRAYGAVIYYDTIGGTSVDVIAYVDGHIHGIVQAYLNDDPVTVSGGYVNALADGSYGNSKVAVGWNNGATPNTAHAPVIAATGGIWTAAHRGDGVVTGYLIKSPVGDSDFLKIYPQGDNVQLSLVADMQYLFDPRDSSMDAYDQSTWIKASPNLENPILALLHYFIVRRGYDYNTRILPQIDKWIHAANVCDEIVPTADEVGRKRYTCAILYDSSAKPSEIIASILETCDGWYCENQSREFVIYAGEAYTPTVTVDSSHIIEYSHQSFVEDENYFNEITVKYFSDLHDYNEVDAQPWRDEDDISERGRVNSTSFAPQTRDYRQARALAKAQMARTNASDRGQCRTNYSGRGVDGQRFINLNINEGGVIFSGVVEITSLQRNTETGGITFEWVKVDPNRYNWSEEVEDGYGAPVGESAPPDILSAPVITDIDVEFDEGAANARVRVVSTSPNRPDLTWFLRWRVTTDSGWNTTEYSGIAAGTSVELLSHMVTMNVALDVQVAYQVGDGRVSEWSATANASTNTGAIPPGEPLDVGATGGTGSATINWRNPSSSNFYATDIYRNSANSFAGASEVVTSEIGGLGVNMTKNVTTSAGTWYFWVTSKNAGGYESDPVATGAIVVS